MQTWVVRWRTGKSSSSHRLSSGPAAAPASARLIQLGAALIGCGTFLGAPSAVAADKKCQIAKVADLPITMNSLRPTIDVKINDRNSKFVLDIAACYTLISSAPPP